MAALPLAGVAVVLFLFNPTQHNFYPRCMLYVTTGIYCPGCGSQRALYQLMHGHLLAALRDNLLLVLALPIAAFYAWPFATRWLAGKPLPQFYIKPIWIKAALAVTIVFTILRNIPGAPFNWLAPL